jgi:hypothetical protein
MTTSGQVVAVTGRPFRSFANGGFRKALFYAHDKTVTGTIGFR